MKKSTMAGLSGLGRRLRVGVGLAAALGVVAACGGGSGGEDSIRAVAWATPPVQVQRDVFAPALQPPATASLSLQAPGVDYWIRYSHNARVTSVSHEFRSADDGIDFKVSFLDGPPRAVGSLTDTLSVRICYDEACTREAAGSPYSLPLRLDVGFFAQAEAGVTPLLPRQTSVLNHDVVGAGYSATLDAVVTVSARPMPMLRVHELASGLTRNVALASAPTALSVSADGLQAAVGHDRAVSLVPLQAGALAPVRRIEVPQSVGAVSLTGQRIVAFGSQTFSPSSVHSVDLLTGTVTPVGTSSQTLALAYGVREVVRHPAGDRLYLANVGLSPDDVFRLDLSDTPATDPLTDSPYHGEHRFCGRLAIAPDGQRLYTGCGVLLSTASNPAADLRHAGQLPLSPNDPVSNDPYRATALDVAPDNRSVALLEQRWSACESSSEQLNHCHTRLAVHDTTTLARRSLLGLAPHVRGNDRLQQWGRHLMHRRDGSLIVLAEVRTQGDTTPTWLVHQVEP